MALQLPPNAGPARDQAILHYVLGNNYEHEWSRITSTHEGHTAEFWVSSDALKVEGVRVNLNASVQQGIADFLDGSLLTAKLCDLMWDQREVTIPPFPRDITSSTEAMFKHSLAIDNYLNNRFDFLGDGVRSTVGKTWVIDNSVSAKKAMNYGWHFQGSSFKGIQGEPTASNLKDETGNLVRLIQGRGTRHGPFHDDYSQVGLFVSRECLVDGQVFDLHDLLNSTALAPLASHQGVVRVLRQPK